MQNISPDTLFTGKQLIYLPQCDSTNLEAQDLLSKNKATEGCVIIAGAQNRGRGQHGNIWEAEPGKNLTLSVILKPDFLLVQQQFLLNIAVSLAVLDVAKEFLPDNLKVKWPNDIYYGNKKLGGILIHNTVSGHLLQHSIVGIGLNVNQISFSYDNAISFAQVAGTSFLLPVVVQRLLELLEVRYLQLKAQKNDELQAAYLQNLYRFQEEHDFLIDSTITRGRILGVDNNGRLRLEVQGQMQHFDLKQIQYII